MALTSRRMHRKGLSGLFAVVLLISVFSGVSGAQFNGWFRFLTAQGKEKEQSKIEQGSPSPTPIPPLQENSSNSSQKSKPEQNSSASSTQLPPNSDSKIPITPPVVGSPLQPKPEPKKPMVPPVSGPPPEPESVSPPNQTHSGSGNKTQQSSGDNPVGSGDSPGKSQDEENCGVSATQPRCQDKGKLVACLQHPKNDRKELFILIQNKGDDLLSVNVKPSASIKIDKLQLPKHNSKKVKVLTDGIGKVDIVLNAGNGDCILHDETSYVTGSSFEQILTYATRMTPIYGAYALFLTSVITGGMWAWCKFGVRRRRVDAGAPYQQLEMGSQPQTSSEARITASDGWDQGWDDYWDEEEGVARPSEKRPSENGEVSTNGITSTNNGLIPTDEDTSKSSAKDGWEDWDD